MTYNNINHILCQKKSYDVSFIIKATFVVAVVILWNLGIYIFRKSAHVICFFLTTQVPVWYWTQGQISLFFYCDINHKAYHIIFFSFTRFKLYTRIIIIVFIGCLQLIFDSNNDDDDVQENKQKIELVLRSFFWGGGCPEKKGRKRSKTKRPYSYLHPPEWYVLPTNTKSFLLRLFFFFISHCHSVEKNLGKLLKV